MNPAAVSLGVLYGVVSAVVCYVLSQITSGLFARPFYRFYSRVLIGICSVMLVAPGLRWLAMSNPRVASIGLTFALYAILAILSF